MLRLSPSTEIGGAGGTHHCKGGVTSRPCGSALVGFCRVRRSRTGRVLVEPATTISILTGLALGSSAVGLTFAAYQLHHFEALFVTLCRT